MEYTINYTYDDNAKRYIAGSDDPRLFGFIVYADTLEVLEREVIRVLRIYVKNDKLGMENVQMIERDVERDIKL